MFQVWCQVKLRERTNWKNCGLSHHKLGDSILCRVFGCFLPNWRRCLITVLQKQKHKWLSAWWDYWLWLWLLCWFRSRWECHGLCVSQTTRPLHHAVGDTHGHAVDDHCWAMHTTPATSGNRLNSLQLPLVLSFPPITQLQPTDWTTGATLGLSSTCHPSVWNVFWLWSHLSTWIWRKFLTKPRPLLCLSTGLMTWLWPPCQDHQSNGRKHWTFTSSWNHLIVLLSWRRRTNSFAPALTPVASLTLQSKTGTFHHSVPWLLNFCNVSPFSVSFV